MKRTSISLAACCLLLLVWQEAQSRIRLPRPISDGMVIQRGTEVRVWGRAAQFHALVLPNTGMAVTIDIGEWNDIHPLDKSDVGRRLALAAEKVAYGEKSIVSSGPLYKSMNIQGNRIIVTFTDVGTGLISRGGGPLKRFEISGNDGKFVRATARILGDSVMVWSSEVKNPTNVRYAWADNPAGANLYNKQGLPASPFETGR